MNDLQIFNNPDFGEIRAVEVGGEPWFVGKDVAAALGYTNPRKALGDHVDEEDKGVTKCYTPGGEQEMTIINESGVYSLIFSSKLPKAKEFKRWVTSEVLPSIRRTGGYLTPQARAEMEDIVVSFLEGFEERLSALEQANAGALRPSRLFPAPEGVDTAPGLAARKRWMRTISEKLTLLSAKFAFMPHNELLHKLYVILEEQYGVSLDENRMQVMADYNLSECSVLTAIFYNPELREGIQRTIDFNLAPENRGW